MGQFVTQIAQARAASSTAKKLLGSEGSMGERLGTLASQRIAASLLGPGASAADVTQLGRQVYDRAFGKTQPGLVNSREVLNDALDNAFRSRLGGSLADFSRGSLAGRAG